MDDKRTCAVERPFRDILKSYLIFNFRGVIYYAFNSCFTLKTHLLLIYINKPISGQIMGIYKSPEKLLLQQTNNYIVLSKITLYV